MPSAERVEGGAWSRDKAQPSSLSRSLAIARALSLFLSGRHQTHAGACWANPHTQGTTGLVLAVHTAAVVHLTRQQSAGDVATPAWLLEVGGRGDEGGAWSRDKPTQTKSLSHHGTFVTAV